MLGITHRQGSPYSQNISGSGEYGSSMQTNGNFPSAATRTKGENFKTPEYRIPKSISNDFANMLLHNSPERSTSAPLVPPPPQNGHLLTTSHQSHSSVRSEREIGFDLSKRLSNLAYTPAGSEIYRSGTPSPITQLQAPVAKRMVKLEMAHSPDGSTDSFLSSASSFDSARYHTRSAQPYSSRGSHRLERSTSFRLRNANKQRRAPLSTEMGRISSPMNESKSAKNFSRFPERPSSGLETRGSLLAKDEKQSLSSNSKYHHVYNLSSGLDSKRRNGRDTFSHSALTKDRLQHISTPLRSKKHLPPRYGETRQQSSQSLPLNYSLQQNLLQQLLEQQALNAAHVGSSGMHGGLGGRGHHSYRGPEGGRSYGNRNGRRGGSGYKGHNVRRAAQGGNKGKNERGKSRKGGHSIEINAIGIGSKMHVRWVEEFGTPKTAHVSLEDVAKRHLTVDLAMDQYGSRFIQQKLEKAPASHKEVTFDQIFPHTLVLCADVFGNYVIQKLFEHGTMEHKKALASKLKGHVMSLSLQMYGCRVVQKAIDVLNLDQKAELIKELHGHVMKCVRDQNGNHVIQKCIERVPPSLIQFVVDAFKGQNMKLAMHPYGCRVIQRLLEHCSSNQRAQTLEEILESTQMLAKNQYGNYVVQHILIHANAEHRAAVMEAFHGSLVKMSKHKFASNVIEKCVTHATRAERKSLIDEMLGDPELDSASVPLMAMARDQYGNYVLQRLIEVADPEQKHYLIRRIQHHLPYLSKVPFGKHIIASIEKAQDPSL
mmetsp:Transcript_38342/g.74336  ORF Transcript_38342/g.74336 Transcript_38342/m.74336 type:complete len:769 (+) Transcript_38342:143-2449(+)